MTSPKTSHSSRLPRAIKIYLDVLFFVGIVAAVAFLALFAMVIPALPNAPSAPDMDVLLRFALEREALQQTAKGAPELLPVRGEGMLALYSRSPRAWALYLGLVEAAVVVMLFAVWQLRAVFKSVVAGHPFSPDNARRVKKIGWVVIGWNVVAPFAKYFNGVAFLAEHSVEALILEPPIDVDVNSLFLGLAILVLGEVFHQAARMQQEQSLTV
jgi:hypothetical protein